MRRIDRSRVLLGAVLLSAMLPVAVASGGQSATIPSELQDILIDQLGFESVQVPRWGDGLVGVGDNWSAFGWGGDASVRATISETEAPWTVPITIGLNYVLWQDPESLPDFGDGFEMNGTVSGSVNGGPTLGSLYAVTTIVMGGEIPLGGPGELYQQWDFVLGIPGLESWEALPQFPDDTWNGGAFVFSLSYGPNPWALSFYSFENGEIVTQDYPGFAIISGNTILMGVEAAPEVFGTGAEISGRLALDVKNAPFNPTRSRVVTAPQVPLGPTAFFPYLGFNAPLVPRLPGLFDLTDFDVFVDEDGELWLKIYPETPWGPMPPDEYFSDYVQWAIRPYGSEDSPPYGGFQTHDGASETFSGLGSERGDPIEGYIMGPDGALLFRTGVEYDGGDLEVFLQGGFLQDEGSTILYNQHRTTVLEEEVGESGDPTAFDDEFPIYDLAVGTTIEPPPPPSTTTTLPIATTTLPVATTTSATVTSTTTGTPSVTGSVDTCWWCWGVVVLLAGFLIAVMYLRLRAAPWWTCWIPWFIVIFVWVPFLLAGLWFWQPNWWWWPLLAWFPLIGGYTWLWARRQPFWRPWMLYVVGGYLAALILGMVIVGSPTWGLLLPLFWIPLVAFYLWARAPGTRWWRPALSGVFVAYVAWIFVWVIWLTPWWAWWFPIAFLGVIGWWFTSNGHGWRAILEPKWCWVIPFAFVPFLGWFIPLACPEWCFVVVGFAALSVLWSVSTHFSREA